MRLFPSSYDRADVLMSAGCSTFVSAALILVIPRVGALLFEILLGGGWLVSGQHRIGGGHLTGG